MKVMLKAKCLLQITVVILFSIYSQYGMCDACGGLPNCIVLTGGEPFPKGATAFYYGTAVSTPGYDMHPTVMYETKSPPADEKKFKMWWFCQFPYESWSASADKLPRELFQADRICYSSSQYGNVWSAPKVVFKALGGTAGSNRGDDHMVGAPSVIKVDCVAGNVVCPGPYASLYVMFYEAFGNWMTKINRFWSVQQLANGVWLGDSLVTNGLAEGMVPGSAYENQVFLGYAPFLVRAGTHAIYSCRIDYYDGKINRYLSRQECLKGPCPGGTCHALKEDFLYGVMTQIPVFWLWDVQGPAGDRKILYRCYDVGQRNTFASLDPNCEGRQRDGVDLGYVSVGWRNGVPTPDMRGALENGIYMAYSPDGENWTRFNGGGGDMPWAIIPASDTRTAYDRIANALQTCAGEGTYELHQTYGAGYPSALIRNHSGIDYVQVFFVDKSDPQVDDDRIDCKWPAPKSLQRVQVALSDLFNASAWRSAAVWSNRDYPVHQGMDIKWSLERNRYFALYLHPLSPGAPRSTQTPPVVPLVLWSEENPSMSGSLSIPNDQEPNRFDMKMFDPDPNKRDTWTTLMPNRAAQYGGLLGDERGNLVCLTTTVPRHCAIHVFTEAQSSTLPYSIGYQDLDHILIFGYY